MDETTYGAQDGTEERDQDGARDSAGHAAQDAGPEAGREGGEPACWRDQVCEACGRVREHPGPDACEHCGATATQSTAPPAARVPGRDRDAAGRARNGRPRDGLGRPLPYGTQGVPRQPEGVQRTPAAALAEAQRFLDTGMPFHAHEVLEDSWKSAPEAERELWRGLAQFAVGLTHAARGNAAGAESLLTRAAERLTAYRSDPPHGIDVPGLIDWARERPSATPPPLVATDR